MNEESPGQFFDMKVLTTNLTYQKENHVGEIPARRISGKVLQEENSRDIGDSR